MINLVIAKAIARAVLFLADQKPGNLELALRGKEPVMATPIKISQELRPKVTLRKT